METLDKGKSPAAPLALDVAATVSSRFAIRSPFSDIAISPEALDRSARALVVSQYLNSPEAKEVEKRIEPLLPVKVQLAETLEPSRHNSARAYRFDQNEYAATLVGLGDDPEHPAWAKWAPFFRGLAARENRNGQKLSPRTLIRKSFSIAKWFFVRNLPMPTRTPEHRQLLSELCRTNAREIKQAKPVDLTVLSSIIASRSSRSLTTLRDNGIHATEATRGLRASTLVGILIENIQFEDRGVVIGLVDEKTATTGELQWIATPHSKDHGLCMPCNLNAYVGALRTIGIHKGPLFRRIDRWGHIGAKALSTRGITYILHKDLARAGVVDAMSYSSHSYRHAVVQNRLKSGLSLSDVMVVTLHRSKRGIKPYAKYDPWSEAPPRLVVDWNESFKDSMRGWRHG